VGAFFLSDAGMCELICIVATGSTADGFCGSSDPAVLLCSGVWGLLSLIGLIAWVRWEGVHPSVRDEQVDKLPELAKPYTGVSALTDEIRIPG
jgi:hypothetical protein